MMATTLPYPGARPRHLLHTIVAALLMACCLLLAQRLTPTKYWADVVGMPDLERLVPLEFGGWAMSTANAGAVVNPQLQASVDAIYDRVLARTYVHRPTGRQIMLSIAYGRNQSTRLQAHAPEMCYRTVGFVVPSPQPVDIQTAFGDVTAMRVEAVLGMRREPMTYWFRAGDKLAYESLERNLARMRFAAKGYLMDGLLFRISEITPLSPAQAFQLQDAFIRELLQALQPADRPVLIGNR